MQRRQRAGTLRRTTIASATPSGGPGRPSNRRNAGRPATGRRVRHSMACSGADNAACCAIRIGRHAAKRSGVGRRRGGNTVTRAGSRPRIGNSAARPRETANDRRYHSPPRARRIRAATHVYHANLWRGVGPRGRARSQLSMHHPCRSTLSPLHGLLRGHNRPDLPAERRAT